VVVEVGNSQLECVDHAQQRHHPWVVHADRLVGEHAGAADAVGLVAEGVERGPRRVAGHAAGLRVCGRCGAFGTVACVTVHAEPPKNLRFCATCWADVRLEYRSADSDPAPPNDSAPLTWESRSWNDAVDFLRLVITAKADPERGKDITPELLREFASELASDADKMDGPMPEEVEAFIREQVGHV